MQTKAERAIAKIQANLVKKHALPYEVAKAYAQKIYNSKKRG